MTTPRTCDALGVCQHRATPCAGCSNAHPAYHHLHRVHHSPATTRTCTADQCQQGRSACPCPQACELPTTSTTAPLADEPASAMELLGLALGVVAVALIVVFAIKTCATA